MESSDRAEARDDDRASDTSAFDAAHAVLDAARAEADRMRAEADRYARQREQDADLLLGKARRVLAVAEDKAAAIIATARVHAGGSGRGLPGEAEARVRPGGARPGLAPPPVYRRVVAPGATTLDAGVDEAVDAARAGRVPSRLDRLLARAIGRAVDAAFVAETSGITSPTARGGAAPAGQDEWPGAGGGR